MNAFAIKSLRLSLGSLSLLIASDTVNARVPAAVCEMGLGAWCIVRGATNIEFASVHDSDHFRWTIYDQWYKEHAGVVMEQIDCRSTIPDQIETIERDTVFEFEGREWSSWTVSLHSGGRCTLRLLFPMKGGVVLDFAAYTMTGLIGICMKGKACWDNTLPPYILNRKGNDGGHQ